MTKPQVYFIIAGIFAIAGCYAITVVFIIAGLLFALLGWLAKLPKLPGGKW